MNSVEKLIYSSNDIINKSFYKTGLEVFFSPLGLSVMLTILFSVLGASEIWKAS